MPLVISIRRVITAFTWHICGNNGCENMVFGIKSVCLRCWCQHSRSTGSPGELKQVKYFEDSL